MQIILAIVDFFLNLDKHLGVVIASYGSLTYGLLFLIIFMETGLVITPFLPGDSLIFAAGAFAAIGALSIWWVYGLVLGAAILGDTVNYWIGHFIGQQLIDSPKFKLIKPEHLERSREFYEQHGPKTIVLARFVPIVRTFAPFLAGVSRMDYRQFVTYNIVGGFIWVTLFAFSGYFFGNLPVVKNNFSIVIFIIIALSVVPMGLDLYRQHCRRNKIDKSV